MIETPPLKFNRQKCHEMNSYWDGNSSCLVASPRLKMMMMYSVKYMNIIGDNEPLLWADNERHSSPSNLNACQDFYGSS